MRVGDLIECLRLIILRRGLPRPHEIGALEASLNAFGRARLAGEWPDPGPAELLPAPLGPVDLGPMRP